MDTLKYGQDEEIFYSQVYEVFGKTKKDIEEYVDLLIKWAESQPHFPEIPTVNGCTVCIVSNKFSVERAKQKLEMYYAIRNLMPEVYAKHPLSPEMIHHNKAVIMVPLPKFTSNRQRVIYTYISPKYEPEDFNNELLLVQLTHVIEILLQEDKCMQFQMIFDCAGAKFGHASKFSPMTLKKLALCLEKVYANRVSAIHLVNFYPFLENMLNTVFRPLFPKKIRDRMKAYGTSDVLLELYDKSILPKDIGGEEKSLEELQEMMFRKYEEYKPRFDKIQYMKVNESLRPSKLENDDILGYYGSFKQIAVD